MIKSIALWSLGLAIATGAAEPAAAARVFDFKATGNSVYTDVHGTLTISDDFNVIPMSGPNAWIPVNGRGSLEAFGVEGGTLHRGYIAWGPISFNNVSSFYIGGAQGGFAYFDGLSEVLSARGGTSALFDLRNWNHVSLSIGGQEDVPGGGYSGGGAYQSLFGVFTLTSLSPRGAVPEPATWAMMLLGFGLVGGAMRSGKRRQKTTVSYD